MGDTILLDIETFPNEGRFWGMYKQHILEVTKFTSVCCYSVKYLDGRQITRAIPDTDAYDERDDLGLVSELWDILDKAENVIAHYGDGFDLPSLRARFSKHSLGPPSPWRSIDTKKIGAKLFYFGGAYTLDHMCQYLGLGSKLDTGGYALWRECLAGDRKAWANMKKYNAHDVVLLEKLYKHILPWINDHPNVASLPDGCPKCGSGQLQSRGVQRSATRTYNRFQCQTCGGWCRSTKSVGRASVTNI